MLDEKGKGKLQVALIGAGVIAHTHIEVLRTLGNVEVIGVCDKDERKVKDFQERWQVPRRYCESSDMLQDVSPDIAHILVPPALHFSIAENLLEKGVGVFVEKPMALRSDECLKLVELAEQNHLPLGVNHNLLYHPAYSRAAEALKKGLIGNIQHVVFIWNMPLGPLQAGAYDNWMLREPKNIIFEQGPHPFSIIRDLIGPCVSLQAFVTGEIQLLVNRPPFYDTWQLALECKEGTGNVVMSFGREFAESRLTIIGQDGSIDVDFMRNHIQIHEKSMWPGFFESFLDGTKNGLRVVKASSKNVLSYGASLFGLQERSDPFYVSMRKSIENFYIDLKNGERSKLLCEKSIEVIEWCERSSEFVPTRKGSHSSTLRKSYPSRARKEEILVIGGTGFIGRHLVQQIVGRGHSVRVMARHPDMMPEEINHPRVGVMQGDIRNAESIARIVSGVSIVYYLAIGEGETWEEMQNTVVGGLARVARACQQEGVAQFHYTSSISALYLGNRCTVTGATPVDEHPRKRGLYARAKIECERLLMEMYHSHGFPVVIYRPAVVVGRGGRPYHDAIGYWVNDKHCIGWGRGLNPLPFVLAEDVASALVNAMTKREIFGKSFLLAGDIRISAREYVDLLGKALQRDICFHPRSFTLLQSKEIVKWLIKKCIKRPNSEFPSLRDLKTRGLFSELDCRTTKDILDWTPIAHLETFIERGVRCYMAGQRE